MPRTLGPFPLAPGAKLVIADADVLVRLDHRPAKIDEDLTAAALQALDAPCEKPVVVIHG